MSHYPENNNEAPYPPNASNQGGMPPNPTQPENFGTDPYIPPISRYPRQPQPMIDPLQNNSQQPNSPYPNTCPAQSLPPPSNPQSSCPKNEGQMPMNPESNIASAPYPQNPGYQSQYNPYPAQGINPQSPSQEYGGSLMGPPCELPPGPQPLNSSISTALAHGDSQKNNKTKKDIFQYGDPVATLSPYLTANPVSDSNSLHKAFQGFGCNKEVIRNILARRTCVQREQIKDHYNQNHSKSLIKRTKYELYEPYERIMMCLLYNGSHLDAFLMHKASKIMRTDESAYRDILSTRSSEQIAKIKVSYHNMYKRNLESVVRFRTFGSFRKILITLLNNSRDVTMNVDHELARSEATEMFSRTVFNINAPSSLIPIFCKRSYPQLLETFRVYQEISERSVYNYIKKFMMGEYEKCLMTIYHFCINPVRYHSKHLRDGIRKQSIYQVTRVVTTRCEIDLGTIIQDYELTYKSNFVQDLKRSFFSTAYFDCIETILILLGEK